MKVALILDMPDSCMGCNFFYVDNEEERETCQAKELARIVDLNLYEKPEWCPLRPLPEKTKPFDLWGYGWNACIDEITGE